MGPVFRAYDAERERLVAIKLFKLDLAPERVHQLVAAFETLVAADLTHPAIARPLATGIADVSAYLVQEYVAAESLDLAVREYGPAPAADTLRVATQLAGALDFARVVDVHHGALHPRDVLLASDETRLTGLGVAQALQLVGVVVPVRRPYAAPERLGNAPIDARADLFSLAAVVCELLTGKRIAGAGESALESLPDVGGVRMPELRRVFARALAENPANRFATALEFVDALKRAVPQPSVAGHQSSVAPPNGEERVTAEHRPTTEHRPAAEDRRLKIPQPVLPLDVPEVSDRADVEPVPPLVPQAAPEAAPAFADDVLTPDLSLAPAGESRDEPTSSADVGVFPAVVDRTRSAVWPLFLALLVGLAVGFATGYAVGGRDRSMDAAAGAAAAAPAATAPSGREFTESAVKPNESSAGGGAGADQTPAPPAESPKPDTSAETHPAPGAEPAAAPGRLLIRSTPAGARVTVDGRDVGVTPAVVRNLATGPHQVRVLRDGYVASERRIVLTPRRQAQSMAFPLVRERTGRAEASAAPEPETPGTMGRFVGALYVASRPAGAKVFLDGKLIGTTPLSVDSVASGEHAVRLEHDGYRRWSSSVRVVASEQNRVTASLER